MSVEGSVRDRRRAETIREIKDAALTQLDETGAASLSLRAVARAIGMTVQSLYHYFDSRDALLAALLVDAHNQLADAVRAAADATAGETPLARRLATTGAFREWAIANRSAFLLIYGTPVPGFDPEVHEVPSQAAVRLAVPFAEAVFSGWTAAEIADMPLPPGGTNLGDVAIPEVPMPLSPGALALFIEMRGLMHGLVMLELIGHLQPFTQVGAEFFTASMHRMSEMIDSLKPTPKPLTG
ncbi:TetR/AcrR family transcriptional regulator [Pseudonocardia sp. TRM90224]|uniref:TetR/AcrR family transcriptional regulator n=1 Tax=Pseudonocardia sp. TRM90224 TaxID=2812678 RepID=UPI001E488DBD|nr:TetR/AcrR family transcriptional regulator [Pseudonocardia sp. TRM90224]